MLAACTDFKERQHLRGALRELKGIRLDGDAIRTYSFSKESLRNKPTQTHEKNGVQPSWRSSVSDDTKTSNNPLQNVTSPSVCSESFEVSKEEINTDNCENGNGRFQSYLFAGSLGSPVPNNSVEVSGGVDVQNGALIEVSKSNKPNSAINKNLLENNSRLNNLNETTADRVSESKCIQKISESGVSNCSSDLYKNSNVLFNTAAKATENPECLPVKHPPDKAVNQTELLTSETNQSNTQANAPPRKPRKISYRTSPFFSQSSMLNPVSSTVSRARLKSEPQRSQSVSESGLICKVEKIPTESVRRSESAAEVEGIFKCRPAVIVADHKEVESVMRSNSTSGETLLDAVDKSSVINVHSGENIMLSQGGVMLDNRDSDKMSQKSKSSLSRKKRVDSDSPRAARIIRKKANSSESPVFSNQTANHEESLLQKELNKIERSQSAKTVSKSGSGKRKLPQTPTRRKSFVDDGEEEEESIHERTIRLLQERRRDRFQKKDDSGTAPEKVKASPEEIRKSLEEKLERSDSQRKALRVRRELQLLQREVKTRSRSPSPSVDLVKLEVTRSRTTAKDNHLEKENQRHIVQRSKSDIVKRHKSRSESESQGQTEGLPPRCPAVISKETRVGEELKPMTPERKINIIGSLMQEEARLQELLRKSTNFSEKRRMRSEVKQLREKRAALEGTADVHPLAMLRRSASVTAGAITPASLPVSSQVVSSENSEMDPNKQAIEQLRRQLGETTDYEEKKRIRLALRQLRQQTNRDGSITASPGLQRSQSFVFHKSSEPISNGDSDVGGALIVRSQSVTDKPLPHQSVTNCIEQSYRKPPIHSVTNGDSTNCDSKTSRCSDDSSSLDKHFDSDKHTSGLPLFSKPPISSTSSIEKRESTLQRLKNLHQRKSTSDIPSCVDQKQQSETFSEQSNNNSLVSNGDAALTAKNSSTQPFSSITSSTKKRHSFVEESRLAFQTEKENKKDIVRRHSVETASDIKKVSHERKPNIFARCEIFEKSEVSPNDTKTDVKSDSVRTSHILVSRADVRNKTDPTSHSSNHLDEEVQAVNRNNSTLNAERTDKNNYNDLLNTSSLNVKHSNSNQLQYQNKSNINNDIKPNIPWLENKKKSIPNDELEKLLSTLDIEKAFNQILDAVDTFPETIEMAETLSAVIQEEDSVEEMSDSESGDNVAKEAVDVMNNDKNYSLDSKYSPKVDKTDKGIQDSEKSTSKYKAVVDEPHNEVQDSKKDRIRRDSGGSVVTSVLHVGAIHNDTNMASCGKTVNSQIDTRIDKLGNAFLASTEDNQHGVISSAAFTKTMPGSSKLVDTNSEDDIPKDKWNYVGVSGESRNLIEDISGKIKMNNNVGSDVLEDKVEKDNVEESAIPQTEGTKKSEARIQLRSNTSLDTTIPETNSAISVIHGDDGAVTVQEVSKMKDGDTTVTELRRVRRTQSRTETRETDTITERKIISPGGSSTVYEKDISTTKRKLTLRGSNYFSRNNYHIRKLHDTEGDEIVEHEMSSETDNVSVSKNESWGDKTTASLMLNRDGSEALSLATGETANQQREIEAASSTSTVCTIQPTTQGETTVASFIDSQLGRPTDCPRVTSLLQDVSALEGDSVTFQCSVMSTPPTSVTWHRGNLSVQQDDDIKIQFDESCGTCSLHIAKTIQKHSGIYKCVFTNAHGSASTSGKLSVQLNIQTHPSFLTDLQDVSVLEGHSLTLECKVKDTDQVLWLRDGVVQRNSPDFRQTFDGTSAQLEITEVYVDDFGTYTCCLKNRHGEERSSCKVSIIESESSDQMVPVFLRKPETQIVDETETAIIECDVIGSPKPTITWSCDKLVLTESDRCFMTYDGRVAQLIFKRVTLRNNGKIECVAENSAGRVKADCLLVVNAKKKAPNVTCALDDITVHSGKSAILECGIMGDPEPSIVWRKNGLIIGQIFDFKHSYKNGLARLEIGKACRQDSGIYECSASNEHGEVTTSCQLTVSDEVPKTKEEMLKVKVSEEKVQTATTKTFPARFVPKVDEDQIQASKRQASKIMLVRQGSLRGMKSEGQPAAVKRSGSFQLPRPKESDPKLYPKIEKESSIDQDKKRVQDTQKDNDIGVESVKTDSKTTELLMNVSNKLEQVGSDTESILKVVKPEKVQESASTKVIDDENKMSSKTNLSRRSYVESIKLDHNKNYKTDINSNVTKTVLPEKVNSQKTDNEKIVAPKKAFEMIKSTTGASKVDDIKTVNTTLSKVDQIDNVKKDATEVTKIGLKSRFSIDTSDLKDNSPLSQTRGSAEIRRSQSVRTPGSEKPEWLQMKLRKVGGGNSNFKKFVTSPGTSSGLSKLESEADKPDVISANAQANTQSSLTLSQSQTEPGKMSSVALKDSTNSPLNTQGRNSVKLTPVSERAKIFQMNEGNSSTSGKSSPTEIISKALNNLSRTESLRSPAGQRQSVVQRSHSFKSAPHVNDNIKSTAAVKEGTGDITLELSKQKAEGPEKKGPDSSPKVIQLWNPDSAPSHKMDYSKMNDEDELSKLLTSSDNFEERKKIRSRLKELREQAAKEWEEKRAARPPPVDLIKQKHAQADLEKKKTLEAFQKKAAEPHELRHLEFKEQLLRDRHKQADEAKKKTLEDFDRRAGKPVAGDAPKAAAGRPAEEIAPALAQQIINATSPAVSGRLTVKTESWSSKDGVTRTSERTETWGAKPVNPFKAADAANAKTNPPGQGRAAMARSPSAIKTMLLDWTKAMTREYAPKVEIANFSTSWNDGMAFCALIHHFYPESFDFDSLDPKERRKNFELAFDTAEKYADIAPLLDVEDMVKMKKPDWKCVFTYVQSFYRKLHTHGLNKAAPASES